jgi:hypothetical protein
VKSTEEVGLVFGTHPLDDDDMTPDIVETVLRKRMGQHNPAVGEVTRDIMARLRAYHVAEMCTVEEKWCCGVRVLCGEF